MSKPSWHRGPEQKDVTTQILSVDIEGQDIAFVRSGSQIVAFYNSCPHLDFPLDGIDTDGKSITCPWHRAEFALPSGELLGGPCESGLKIFPTEIRDQCVWVEL